MNISSIYPINTRQPVINAQPSIELPEKSTKLTPEQLNNTADELYLRVTEKQAETRAKAEAQWNKELAHVYVNSQKAVVNAYSRSATGENAYEINDEEYTLTERYEALRLFSFATRA